ncbi:MAG TPA: M20 family metallopeptidase [Trebonia sp.]|jgi:succinyl-diaminopimelate desuccinylase|nr:M20 family metallopeptidase [Trebonia sp.]
METASEPDIDVPAMISFVRDLVRVRSVHDPGAGPGESAVAALVVARMREFGWEPEVSEVAPGRPNVIATIDGGGGPGPVLAFEGHTDVVTEGDRSEWTVDPFGAEVRDGRIYGRGSADMKAGLAAMMYAAAAVQAAGPFPGTIKVCALADEEGMMLGAKHACATGALAGVDGVIVCEPEAGEVCAVAKGALRLRVDVTGKMAHGAMPQHGRNPLPALGLLLSGLGDLQADLQRRHAAHEHLGPLYLTPTVAAAGTPAQQNVIPRTASAYVDVRTIPGADHADIVARVADLATRACAGSGLRSSVTVIDDRPPVDTPATHPVVACLAAAHEEVTGSPARYGGVPGTTDGTILTRDAGLATVVYGPGGKWIAHQADEFVEISDVVTCARVYARAAVRFTGRAQAARSAA